MRWPWNEDPRVTKDRIAAEMEMVALRQAHKRADQLLVLVAAVQQSSRGIGAQAVIATAYATLNEYEKVVERMRKGNVL